MPKSWVSVPTETSPAMSDCMRGNKARARVCTEQIAGRQGVAVLAFHWEEGKVGRRAIALLEALERHQIEAAISELDAELLASFVEFAAIYGETDTEQEAL